MRLSYSPHACAPGTRSRSKRWRDSHLAHRCLSTILSTLVPLATAGPPLCDSGTPLSHGCWARQCPSMITALDQLCQYGFDHLFRLSASGSCFNADFSEKLCCGYEMEVDEDEARKLATAFGDQVKITEQFGVSPGTSRTGNHAKSKNKISVVNPSCFQGDDIFRALSPAVCCDRSESPVLLRTDVPMNVGSGDCFDSNGASVSPTLDRFLEERCPEAKQPYKVVQQLQKLKSQGEQMKDESLRSEDEDSAAIDLFQQSFGKTITWVEAVRNRFPLPGLRLRQLQLRLPQQADPGGAIIPSPRPEPEPLDADDEDWSATPSSTDLLEEPTDLLQSDKRKVAAYLQLAVKLFRGNDTSTWEPLVDLAENEYKAKYADDHQVEEDAADIAIWTALDTLWSLFDGPFRWRDMDYKRSETWSLLFRAAEKLDALTAENEERDLKEGIKPSAHIAKGYSFSSNSENASPAADNNENPPPPPHVIPFLQFKDDFILYPNAEKCGHLTPVMRHFRKEFDDVESGAAPASTSTTIGLLPDMELPISPTTRKLIQGTSASTARPAGTTEDEQSPRVSSGFVVLDVGAGTAPCEELWNELAGEHVYYLKQDFGMYDTTLDPDARGRKIHADARSQGLSPFAFASSIHNKKGYSELDVTSDIIDIPLPSNSIDLIVCDQVLEHLPKPVAAMREIFRLLKKGGMLLLSHPYGSFLHNLPFHYNGGFTHAWFERHLLGKGIEQSRGEVEGFFTKLWWNYRFEKQGQALQRVLNDVDCLQNHLHNFADKRIYRELLLRVVPQFVDSLPGLCPGGSERKVQAVHIVAVK